MPAIPSLKLDPTLRILAPSEVNDLASNTLDQLRNVAKSPAGTTDGESLPTGMVEAAIANIGEKLPERATVESLFEKFSRDFVQTLQESGDLMTHAREITDSYHPLAANSRLGALTQNKWRSYARFSNDWKNLEISFAKMDEKIENTGDVFDSLIMEFQRLQLLVENAVAEISAYEQMLPQFLSVIGNSVQDVESIASHWKNLLHEKRSESETFLNETEEMLQTLSGLSEARQPILEIINLAINSMGEIDRSALELTLMHKDNQDLRHALRTAESYLDLRGILFLSPNGSRALHAMDRFDNAVAFFDNTQIIAFVQEDVCDDSRTEGGCEE